MSTTASGSGILHTACSTMRESSCAIYIYNILLFVYKTLWHKTWIPSVPFSAAIWYIHLRRMRVRHPFFVPSHIRKNTLHYGRAFCFCKAHELYIRYSRSRNASNNNNNKSKVKKAFTLTSHTAHTDTRALSLHYNNMWCRPMWGSWVLSITMLANGICRVCGISI